jgi:hypothetical protein
VIPEDWIPYHREEDGELVGYLVPETDGLVRPATVFGYLLGPPTSRQDAEQVLDSVGLSYLADRWLLRLPDRADPIAVRIVEASPTRLVVQNADFGYEGDIGARFVLDVPETGRLSRA